MVFNIVFVLIIYNVIKNDVAMLTGGLALAAAGGSIVNAVLNGVLLIKKFPGIIKKSDA